MLFESGLDKICDTTVFVDTPYSERKKRVEQHRNWSEDDLIKRESAQMPLDAKRAKSNHVLMNYGTLDDLDSDVKCLVAKGAMDAF